jgi:hypothetical protein
VDSNTTYTSILCPSLKSISLRGNVTLRGIIITAKEKKSSQFTKVALHDIELGGIPFKLMY